MIIIIIIIISNIIIFIIILIISITIPPRLTRITRWVPGIISNMVALDCPRVKRNTPGKIKMNCSSQRLSSESRLIGNSDLHGPCERMTHREQCKCYVHGDRNRVSWTYPLANAFFKVRLVPAKVGSQKAEV